jgi:hypothetical protein
MTPFLSPRLPFDLNLWVAARLLPFLVKNRPLDEILVRATPDRGSHGYGELSASTIIAKVKRVVARPMRMRGRRCLREGLLAFHYLSLAGHRPVLHFGLVPQTIATPRPQAHCWVTIDDETVINPPATPMIELFAYDGSTGIAASDARLARASYD